MKKGRIFAPVINNEIVENEKRWCCSSVWLECLPVTQEVASSSLVSTAKRKPLNREAFLFLYLSLLFHKVFFLSLKNLIFAENVFP